MNATEVHECKRCGGPRLSYNDYCGPTCTAMAKANMPRPANVVLAELNNALVPVMLLVDMMVEDQALNQAINPGNSEAVADALKARRRSLTLAKELATAIEAKL